VEVGGQVRYFRQEIQLLPSTHANQNGVFLIGRWSSGHWTAAPGLRYDRHSTAGGVATPRMALLFAPSRNWLFSTSVERSHRTPNFEEIFSTATGNATLKPEKALSADIGAAWKPTADTRLAVTGFVTQIKDVIHLDTTINKSINEGEEKNQGVEFEGMFHHRKTTLSGNATMQTSERKIHPSAPFVPSALSPERLAFVKLEHELPRGITIANELRSKSRQFELDDHQGLMIPSYFVWNFRVRIHVLSAIVHADVENILNKRYADNLGSGIKLDGTPSTVLFPQAARSFWCGITIRFEN
jgi:outer membrane cobalamin receptor